MSFRPWLHLPAKLAHDLAPIGLDLAASFTSSVDGDVRGLDWSRKNRKIHFRNPLGTAGGVDKDGLQIAAWNHFGAGFVEIGTVTPRPQTPNPGTIIGRDNAQEALWNRMGFPGLGAHFARRNLREWRMKEQTEDPSSRFPIFVNIGKQRETTLEDASRDYTWLVDFFSQKLSERPLVDAFVINISSPNTKGLRELFSRERLTDFLAPIAEKLELRGTPGLLKLSPDMDDETFHAAVSVATELDLDGFIATNTTAARPKGVDFPEEGGLSGAPLALRSREILKNLISTLGSSREGRLLVSAGGVLDGAEANLRLTLGADLVETYSGLVFHGPQFFSRALRDLACVASDRLLV